MLGEEGLSVHCPRGCVPEGPRMGSLWHRGLRSLGWSRWSTREEAETLALTIFSLEFLDRVPGK